MILPYNNVTMQCCCLSRIYLLTYFLELVFIKSGILIEFEGVLDRLLYKPFIIIIIRHHYPNFSH